MPFNSQKIPINGKLNKDTDLSKVPQGDRLDALNTSFLVDENNTENSVKSVKGNELAYTIPAVTAQNKTIRIYFEAGSVTDTQTINFLNQNGGVLAIATFNYGTTANATMLSGLGSCLASLSTAGIPTSHTQGTDYFELTLTPVGIVGAEWTITRTSSLSTDALTYIVLQEAIPLDLTGEQHIIGKNTQPGVRFEWSTTQVNMPQTIPFSTYGNITYSLGVVSFLYFCVRLITSNPHNLQTGQVIQITNAPVGTNADGIWSVNVIDAFTFDLVFSVFGVFGSGSGDITINVQGYGQIGAVQYDVNTDVWTYTRLIGSKDFNFVRPKQIDNHVEYAGGRYSFYFTDDYNVIRSFYYDGPFVTDGAIGVTATGTNPLGIYQYGSIGIETSLLLSGTNINFDFIQQLQTGGQVPSGNNRYTICFLTENFTRTLYLDLSNPINVFSASTLGSPTAIIGDPAGTVTTGKVNQFEVTGIIPGLFKYVELVRVNYVGVVATSIKTVLREVLTGSSITLYDRGDNAGTTDLSAGELLRAASGYLTAKNIRAIDNRLIISNLTTSAEKDLSVWAQTFTHGIFIETENAVGNVYSGGLAHALAVGEYQLPENVYSKVGYMHNEVYRFGCKVKFKNGTYSNTFWVDDIIINDSATNNSGVANPNRRFQNLSGYDLTDVTGSVINIAYVKFGNINFDYLINGIRVRDLIDEVVFERVELDSTTEEILATGMLSIGVKGNLSYKGSTSNYYLYGGDTNNGFSSAFPIVNDYPFNAGGTSVYWNKVGGPNWSDEQMPQMAVGSMVANRGLYLNILRDMASFYSPDLFLGGKKINSSTQDKIFNYGSQAMNAARIVTYQSPDFFDTGTYQEYSGFSYNQKWDVCNVQELYDIPTGGIHTFSNGEKYSKVLYFTVQGTPVLNKEFNVSSSPVVLTNTSTPLNNKSGLWDNGFYYCQYYRSLSGSVKFSNTNSSKYSPVGSSIKVTNITPNITNSSAVSVFGGDTFTQKTYFKLRNPIAALDGFGQGVSFYSQNKINTQMKEKQSSSSTALFPAITTNAWLGDLNPEPLYYNHGYDIQNAINIDSAFDPNAKQITDLPTRVAWSDLKPVGSVIDFYRYFYPFQFHDLDATQGEITNHENFNGELVTWQLRALQRQFFNSRGQLQTSTTSLVIGDGSVMQRDGVRVTGYGSQHKWSVLKGKSKSGDDYYAWVNAETKSVQALGMNGTDVISESKDMNSWFNKNITWASLYDTPADGNGICGVWYENNNQFYWTFMGHRKVAEWVQPITGGYSIGDVVSYSNGTYSTFNETPDFYRSTINNNSKTPSISSSSYWELIPHTDRNYYNEYTLAFTNYKQVYSFTEFFSFKPKIYLEWGNTFMTPRPVGDTGSVYLHWEGDYGVWYDNTITKQEEEGYIQLIFNTDTDLIKHFLAVLISSEVAPYKIDFVTKNHTSTLLAADFDAQIDQFQAGIKEDQTNPANLDASALWGQYVKIKIYFEPYVYQKLNSFVLKYFAQPRTYNK